MAAEKDKGPAGSASAEIGKYLDILAKDPNSRVFAPLAEAYRKAGLLEDAIETALEGLKVHPNYLGGRVALGRAYFEKKQYADAAAEMQKVVKAAPDNLMAHKVLGQILYAQNDLPSAEKAFRMVLLLDPRDQDAKQFLSDIGAGAAPPPPPPPAAPTVSSAHVPSPQRPAVPPPAPPSPAPAPPPPPPPSAASVPLPPPPPPQRAQPEPEPIEVMPALEVLEAPPAEPLEELPELAIDDLAMEPEPPVPTMAAPAAPAPPAQPPAAVVPPLEADLEFEVPGFDMTEAPPAAVQTQPQPAPTAAAAPAVVTPAAPPAMQLEATAIAPPAPARAPAPEADGGMELEVFTRQRWGAEREGEPAAGSAAEPAAESGGESPFEVFGRPMRSGPPVSSKGEHEAYAEIELEPTAHAAVEPETGTESDSPFEMFTREPRGVTPTVTRTRGEGGAFGEIELETTAYSLPEPADDGSAPTVGLEEELPRIDLQSELAEGLEAAEPAVAPPPVEAVPPPAAVEAPVAEEALEVDLPEPQPAVAEAVEPGSASPPEAEPLDWDLEPAPAPAEIAAAEEPSPWDDLVVPVQVVEEEPAPVPTIEPLPAEPGPVLDEPEAPIEPEPVPAAVPEPEPVAELVPEPVPEQAPAIGLDDELPSIDLAAEVARDSFEEESGDLEAEGSGPGPGPGQAEAAAPRGVFDTETLASIYVNQGFYDRAAEIYQRLVAQRPDDGALRQRLAEILALEESRRGGGSALRAPEPLPGPDLAAATAADAYAAPLESPAPSGRKETLRRLNTLLEAFRGGPPR